MIYNTNCREGPSIAHVAISEFDIDPQLVPMPASKPLIFTDLRTLKPLQKDLNLRVIVKTLSTYRYEGRLFGRCTIADETASATATIHTVDDLAKGIVL